MTCHGIHCCGTHYWRVVHAGLSIIYHLFTVQSRDHLATITDIYVPSFPYVLSPALNAGFHFVHCAMENCLDLAIGYGIPKKYI